jgi:hypothetical protein
MMDTLLKIIWMCYNIILEPILNLEVSIRDSLRTVLQTSSTDSSLKTKRGPVQNTMPRKLKRKSPTSPAGRDSSPEPYPSHSSPTPEQCLVIRDTLLAFHGFPEEFAPFRVLRLGSCQPEEDAPVQPLSTTVLDGLVITLLSQNTTDAISRRAFASLKAAFPSWDQVSYK